VGTGELGVGWGAGFGASFGKIGREVSQLAGSAFFAFFFLRFCGDHIYERRNWGGSKTNGGLREEV